MGESNDWGKLFEREEIKKGKLILSLFVCANLSLFLILLVLIVLVVLFLLALNCCCSCFLSLY